jgi:SAM-dependent methyltransferase
VQVRSYEERSDVLGLDYTEAAVAHTQAHCAALNVSAQVVRADALSYQPEAPFDAIYEQTCLCAIHPDHWQTYAAQLHRWLKPGGQVWGLFMQMLRPAASEEGQILGPPYHCDIHAMRALFPSAQWDWPKPPYARVPHPTLQHELALVLTRR